MIILVEYFTGAEGYERNTNKEYIQFLHIAKGSCGELRTQLYIAGEVGIISKEKSQEFIGITKEISAMLFSLIKTRQKKF